MHTDESILPSSLKIKLAAVSIPNILFLYVLSVGPVAKFEDYGMTGARTERILEVVYAPLKLIEPIPGSRSFLRRYMFHVWNCDTMGDNTL